MRGAKRVSKDDARAVPSISVAIWFETRRFSALLTMRREPRIRL
jgi:hypothetical protein